MNDYDTCAYCSYDEELDCYACEMNLDENGKRYCRYCVHVVVLPLLPQVKEDLVYFPDF